MSAQENSGNIETLFSFEILIHSVRIEKEYDISDELAVGVRLLDFPTLLIYQHQQDSGGISEGEHNFNRGKSCFFKMNINSIYNQLSNMPLFAMVLDVKEDVPKLVGTSLISLSKMMDRLRVDVADHGVASSSYSERGHFSVCSFNGEKIGSISLSYKLLSLGISLLPHVTESRGINSIGVQGKQNDCVVEMIKSIDLMSPKCGNDCSPTASNNNLVKEDAEDSTCLAILTENLKSHSHETEACHEEDLTIFHPPHLFFCNTLEEKYKNQEAHRLLNLGLESFAFEDTYSEEDTTADKVDAVIGVKYDEKLLRHQQTQTNGITSNVLGEALQQMPLLNALLVELSQLNNQNLPKPLLIHPNLAWIYRPASKEPSSGHGSKAQMIQTEAMNKTRLQSDSLLKHLHTPRTCSAPVCRTACMKDKKEQASAKNKSSRTSHKKKLVFGTTRAFHLRLNKVSHLRGNHGECVKSPMSKEQPSVERRMINSSHKTIMSGRRKLAQKQNESLNDNTEMAIQSVALRETVTLKQRKLWENDCKKDRYPSGNSDQSASDGEMTIINVDFDTVGRNVTNENQLNVSQTTYESGGHGRKIQSTAKSRQCSTNSAFSDSSVEEIEEAEYSDDFNSLHPSDAHSSNPVSSLESSRAKTPRSPISPDIFHSSSEHFGTRPILHVQSKSSGSPRGFLSSGYVIRPRATTPALSFSSDDVEMDRSLLSQTRTSSRKQRVGTSSSSDSFISLSSHNSKLPKNNNPIQRLSAKSQSSLEPEEPEELRTDLGTLMFKKEYQNMSDLLTSPAYII